MNPKSNLVAPVMIGLLLAISSATLADTAAKDPSQLAQTTAAKALDYLKSQQQPDFGWQNQAQGEFPGITALVQKAFLSDPEYKAAKQDFLNKSFNHLLTIQQPDGGIYVHILADYNTAICISTLAISKEEEYQPAIDKALAYLRTLQWSDKIQGVPDNVHVASDKDPRYGGFGYGRSARPDLSNTQFALDALHDAGVPSADPAFVAALKFATRCQNFSETNDQPWAGNDGGFIYTPAKDGMSPAGDYILGGRRMLRSYGSMTYAGLKSMIYAGLSHDDPRVKAAWGWISRNFTVDENPGMAALGPDNAKGGLFYYYYTMSRALSAYGQPIIVDPQGHKHDWRQELIDKIASLQATDGSFVGERRWMEDSPVLVTSYTVIALEEAKKDLQTHPAH
jgi:squalene-hopene/tetraprenyl-beta-curcumene cyclase